MEMKDRRIEVSIGKTISLGDFEFVKIDVGLSGSIKDDVSLKSSFNKVYDDLRSKLDVYADDLETQNANVKIRKKRK